MNWIEVTERLPSPDECVLVWIKYSEDDFFQWTKAELDIESNYYIEPNSGVPWLMGSAKDYVITHWAKVETPK